MLLASRSLKYAAYFLLLILSLFAKNIVMKYVQNKIVLYFILIFILIKMYRKKGTFVNIYIYIHQSA